MDSLGENVFLTSSELGLCGRPLSDDPLTLPLSRELLLPENLDTENDLKQAERQRPSQEACQAQKGIPRWMALAESLLTTSGTTLKNKPCILVNLTPYIEDVGVAVSRQGLSVS